MALPSTDPDALAALLASLLETLEHVAHDRSALSRLDFDTKKRLLAAMGRIASPDSAESRRLGRQKRKEARHTRREEDRALMSTARIRELRAHPLFLTPRWQGKEPAADPSPGTLHEARTCYVCREPYHELHFFYDQMCRTCGDFNYHKRQQTADLRGRVALVTGGRVKIGYQACILLLRAGCRVLVTTRFPRDAASRYAAEPDYPEFADRLQIHGIDLRHTPSVEALCAQLLREEPRLDFIINNACQTVRRPPGFYAHLMEGERAAPQISAEMSQIALLPEDAQEGLFPQGWLDADRQQVDLRRVNSWRLKAADVATVELLEVHLVNAVAPFVLNARLKALMLRTPERDKHIVNVSAMEGQFYRTHKTDRHPHTNMAKAALNMLTRTSAADYVEAGIHMNSVDTGWVTDEDPLEKAQEKQAMHNFHPPLDIVDGAARICDPIFAGMLTGEHVWGQFLKDYKSTDW